MIGLRWDTCNEFGLSMHFVDCVLDYSVMSGMDLRKTTFDNCSMLEVDLSESNLSQSKLVNCNLIRTTFDNTKLVATDLRGSIDFDINPKSNDINNMKISRVQIEGLLNEFDLVID